MRNKSDQTTILTIDDEYIVRKGIADYLEDSGFRVLQAENGSIGVDIFRSRKPDMILCDLRMPVMNGMEVIEIVAAESPETPIIIVSGTGDISDAIKATQLGAWDYVLKPIVDTASLDRSMKRATERADLMKQNRIYKENLENALRVADHDLQMAINVQMKFFPKDPPKSDKWDVAYYFRPMSGVSGDLYDFYESDGTLNGIALFDVSGHGIASALITMIAKSILFRCFTRMRDKALNEVIETVNHDLIDEIDNVDNYLTGVMLRFNGTSVEYVNAAHPNPLIKQKGNGRVINVGIEYNYEQGTFLGVGSLSSSYNMLRIPVQKDDYILVYTDGLIESANSKGETYGIKRLTETLEKVPADAASGDALDFIMNAFHAFVDQNPLIDDCTVILLKRLS